MCREPIIGFKGIPSGDVGMNGASKPSTGDSGNLAGPSIVNDLVQSAAIASGQYSFYQVRRLKFVRFTSEDRVLGVSHVQTAAVASGQ